ncbi:InlB B-repeat-containing protein, partial [Candidatus Saccharibacteria bacterium]|nr:InlB B-repeat-containing protein [Candidatus Saccharibacteria bacterium]
NAKNYIATSSTATGSETTLSRDTWGVGKTASAFSGLPAYAADISSITPFYTGTTSASYDFYYGVNVSTAKTPGTYTGEVLYTVLMDSACTSYTLNFNGNSATTNTLTSRDIAFDDTIDLSTISSSSVIARTGYTLTGWKDQNNNSYGITGTVDINPGDLSSVTLTALWTANTYTIAYAAGSTGGTCSFTSTSATYDQNVTLSSTKCTKSGYEQKGWSTSSSASNTKTYNLGQTLTKPSLTAINGGTVTLSPFFESTVAYMQGWTGCSSLATNKVITLTDSRDNNQYRVKKLADGKCWMVDNLLIVNKQLSYLDSNISSNSSDPSYNFTIPASSNSDWGSTSNRNHAYYAPAGTTGYPDWASSGSATLTKANTYYSFYTATAGYSYYGDGKTSGSSSYDICPKGWRLPKVTDNGSTISSSSPDDVYNLAKSYNQNASWSGSDAAGKTTTDSTIVTGVSTGDQSSSNYAGFGIPLFGTFYAPTGTWAIRYIGNNVTFMTSSVASSNYSWYYYVTNSAVAVHRSDYGEKNKGHSVRCLVK